ncbi:MAG: serine/threonine protein kinase [Chloroflexi bacterium]|nr:serine/threonine protein kinase [Chloroflexota bacterium]
MSFKPGENVGAYHIIEQLGQGGMATVFKAYHAALDRYVALKVLHQAFNEDSTFISRFQREARVVARLEHPNIVPVYDYAEHEARPYLVMKFIEGDTLKARLNKGRLTSAEIEQVVDSVGSALAYAHRQGVLHRDIKPSNVLISNNNVMYLADFGLARIAQAGEATLSSDSIMGTPQYISPEQALGKKDLDGKTDIYSFGVMLYEMVVGRVPFTADTPFSIIHDHIYTPLPLPHTVNPSVPEPIERVLLKSLAKDRLDRYQTVEEMVEAFRQAWMDSGVPVQGTSIKVRPASIREEIKTKPLEAAPKTVMVQRPASKRVSGWVWVAGGLTLILCFVAGLFALRGRSFRQTQMPTQTATAAFATEVVEFATQEAATEESESAEVAAARELVKQTPADPNAHLQLSLALWDDEQFSASYEALAHAANLARPTNRDFYLNAAEEFKIREAWIPAAGMYLRLAAVDRGDPLTPELQESLREALYKASAEKDMPLFVFFERVDAYDLPFGFVIRGRYALYNGTVEEAKLQLANAEKVKADLYEAFLLKAEIEMKAGSLTAAKTILISLSSDLAAPDWIRLMAEDYLKTIQ